MSNHVRTAVIPCAGLGTRMLPLTRVVPKELLPLGSKPLIEHALDELREVRIEKVVIVTREGKEILQRHLLEPYPYPERAHCPSPLPKGVEIEFVVQKEPIGLGDALLAARESVGDEPFLMSLPDQLFLGSPSAAAQLIQHYDGQETLSSMVQVKAGETELFAGARGFSINGGSGPVYEMTGLLGETGVPQLSSDNVSVRGFGRTVFSPKFFEQIRHHSDESEFSLAFTRFADQGRHEVVMLDGRPVDVGTRIGYQHFWKHWDSITAGVE